MFYGGIDVAKYRHEICIVDESGNVILQIFVDNTRNGLDKLIHNLKRLEIEVSNVEFCLEATPLLAKSLLPPYRVGYKIHVINPIQSDALRNFYVVKLKQIVRMLTFLQISFVLVIFLKPNLLQKLFLSCKTYHGFVSNLSGKWVAKKQGSRYP